MKKRVFMIATLILSCSVVGAQIAAQHRATALAFARRIGSSDAFRSEEVLGEAIGVFIADESTIYVDLVRNVILEWVDDSPATNPRNGQPGEPAFRSEVPAWRVAEHRLAGIGVASLPRDTFAARKRNGEVIDYELRFLERPGGYKVRAGNLLIVNVNAWSGKLVRVRFFTGFTNEPARIVLSESQAAAKFAARVRAVTGSDPTESAVGELVYSSGGDVSTGELG